MGAALIAMAIASCAVERRDNTSQILRLASGDSVLILATSPKIYPNGDTALFCEYHPFISLKDTASVRALAVQLWDSVRPMADTFAVRWAVLKATTKLTAMPVTGIRTWLNYGMVFKKSDGVWHLYEKSTAAPTR